MTKVEIFMMIVYTLTLGVLTLYHMYRARKTLDFYKRLVADTERQYRIEKNRADILAEQYNHSQNELAASENELRAVDIRDSHYPSLQAEHLTLAALVVGMKGQMETSPSAPYGKFTGRFAKFEDLVLFLMFDADPADFRRRNQ